MPTIKKPRPGNIQTIIVNKVPGLTKSKAKDKAIKAGAKAPIPDNLIDETETAFRFRQRNPSDFIKGSFRSFKVKSLGVIIVYGKLRGGKMSEFRFIPVLLSEEAIPKKVQLLRAGNFFHDGRDIKISNHDLKNMVKNFSEKVRGIDLMIDFSHNSEGEAAGWIKNLVLSDNDNQLWAEVDWTPSGLKSLENKAFKYISADFSFDYKDNEKLDSYGATLFGAGLTNRPVVKSMEPIVLSENNNLNSEVTKMANGDYEKEALQEGEGNEELEALIKQLKDDLLKKDEELIALRKELEENKLEKEERLAEMEKEKELGEKNKAFDKKLSEGLVVEAQRNPFIENDMEKFLSLQHEIKLSETGTSKEPESKMNKENFEAKVIALAEKKAKEEKLPIDEAIGKVLKENIEIEKLYNSIA